MKHNITEQFGTIHVYLHGRYVFFPFLSARPFLEMRLIAPSQAKILCCNPGRLMSILCMVMTSMMMPRPRPPPPRSCDTFVVVAADGSPVPTVFGKNSDRPCTEVHEIVRYASADHQPGSTLRCQYIDIPQVPKTYSVCLSRPAWLWGAEMGSNEHGLCCGNEAVFSRVSGECDDGVSRLLGMDIVRLVLERAKTSKEAVEIAGALMEAHGQGGNCEEGGSWCYENGFLFADSNEAWVFETAGIHWWAAERVGKGKSRNISNGITIRKPDMMHAGLASRAIAKGWWKGTPEDFDWKVAMLGGSSSAAELEPEGRERAGKEWLAKLSGPGKSFTWRDMATILRDTDSGICMTGGFESTGSQISILHTTVERPIHFFTTNSNPEIGCYKPFGFDADGGVGDTTKSTRNVWEAYKANKSKAKGLRDVFRAKEETLAELAAKQGATPSMFDDAVAAELALIQG